MNLLGSGFGNALSRVLLAIKNGAEKSSFLRLSQPLRWATNLGGGSTTNGRDSAGKRLGIKLGHGKCQIGDNIK